MSEREKVEVGDIVKAVGRYRLACGSGIYLQAVCVGTKPLVLCSESGDMLWFATLSPGCVKTVGKADERTLAVCTKRYEGDVQRGAAPKQEENL